MFALRLRLAALPVLLAAVLASANAVGDSLSSQSGLSSGQQHQLARLVAQHKDTRARLSPADRDILDRLMARVHAVILARHLRGNLREQVIGLLAGAGMDSATANIVSDYVLDGIASNDDASLADADEEMQSMQMSFNLQYLGLQNQMQNENRQFTMVSNIMKTKRDTAENAIKNIK